MNRNGTTSIFDKRVCLSGSVWDDYVSKRNNGHLMRYEQKQSRKNSGNRSVGCSGYDIYRAELPFHFWLVINMVTMRDSVERYSRSGSYNYSNDWEEGVYIHTMQHY